MDAEGGGWQRPRQDRAIVAGEIKPHSPASAADHHQRSQSGVDRITALPKYVRRRGCGARWACKPGLADPHYGDDAVSTWTMPLPVPLDDLGIVRARLQCQRARFNANLLVCAAARPSHTDEDLPHILRAVPRPSLSLLMSEHRPA